MMKIPFVFVASLMLAFTVQADIYKCRQPNGSTEISNSPCSGGSSTVKALPADTVSEADREQAERNADRLEEYADKLEAKRLEQEEADRKERERQAAAAALVNSGPSAANIEYCLRTLDRMALDPARRSTMEYSCRNTGAVQPVASPEPYYYYGTPAYVQPHPHRPVPRPLPTPPPPGSKPDSAYQVPNNYYRRN